MQAYIQDLEKSLETYFLHKAPKMPQELQDILVKFGPWLMLLMLIFSVVGLLGSLAAGSFVTPFAYAAGKTAGILFTIIWALSIVILVIQAMALPGLFKREMRSWRLLFYATLVGILQNVIAMNFLGLIIGAAIGFYILFQIKHNYR